MMAVKKSAAAIKSLSLIIPGLLDGLNPDLPPDLIRQQAGLSRLLDRADATRVDESGFENTLLHVMAGECQSISLAWLTRQGEQDVQGSLPAQRAWLRADPVLMQAARNNVVMFGSQALAIQQHEADTLIAELNAAYADLDWIFEAPDPQRWYLHMPASPRIRCTALSDMIGRNVRDLMPTGEDSLFWHRTLNEIQMLFYQSPVNLARREAGATEINSVWIWGNGKMELQTQTDWSYLCGDDVLLRGLAVACDIEIKPLPLHANAWLENIKSGNQLVLLPDLQQSSDTDKVRVLQQYEQNWFAPLLAMLRNRQIDSIEIWPCNGTVYRVTRGMLLRFWRQSGWQHTADRT